MIERLEYLEQLIALKDKDFIKVVSGIRGCGKSTLFDLYGKYLRAHGVTKQQMIRINLENVDFIRTYEDLYDFIESFLIQDQQNYVFLDEVQNSKDFQKCIERLCSKENVDLYIAGSNANLLSSEMSTLLSGKYVEIKMLPLSFKEYVGCVGEHNLNKKYFNYRTRSSFPYTIKLNAKKEIHTYLEGIFNTILVKDIAAKKGLLDFGILENIMKFMFENIGNLCSSTKIANALYLQGKSISVPTVESYLKALTDAFILYKVDRYDVKGKQYLSSGAKYYLADIGLRYNWLGSQKADQERILENIVYLELIRRGYKVSIGKVDRTEVDFMATNEKGTEYYQVADTVYHEETLRRELKPLESIRDHNPKYLLTMDFMPYTSHNGIKQINVLEWLLERE